MPTSPVQSRPPLTTHTLLLPSSIDVTFVSLQECLPHAFPSIPPQVLASIPPPFCLPSLPFLVLTSHSPPFSLLSFLTVLHKSHQSSIYLPSSLDRMRPSFLHYFSHLPSHLLIACLSVSPRPPYLAPFLLSPSLPPCLPAYPAAKRGGRLRGERL